jgi:hypothetical protein
MRNDKACRFNYAHFHLPTVLPDLNIGIRNSLLPRIGNLTQLYGYDQIAE